MKNKNLNYLLIGALIGGIVIWVVSFSVINSSNMGMMQMMGFRNTAGLAKIGNSDNMDQHFIEQMIPHHEDAITMSRFALDKAQRPEIRKLAENIIDSQSREITQMKNWYKSWYGKDVPQDTIVMGGHGMGRGSSMHMGMMGDTTDITRLEEATDFDKAFIEEMIPHHQMAVMMANMLQNSTQKAEMKKLAQDIIKAQTSEIDLMRNWYRNWGY